MAVHKSKNSGTKNVNAGMIPEDFYSWFVGGVMVGGVVIVPIGTAMLVEEISPVVAWIGGIVSSVVFLLCLDKQGNFRWATAIPAMGVAAVGAMIYHHSTGQPVVVVGGVLGFIIYAIFGSIGTGIGMLVRGKNRTDKEQLCNVSNSGD